MTQTLHLASQTVADDLRSLLEEVDSARWRDEFEAAARERLASIAERIRELAASDATGDGDARVAQLRERLAQVRCAIDGAAKSLPSRESLAASVQGHRLAWAAFQRDVQPSYEALAASLGGMTAAAPRPLRPTNYSRNVFHVSCGLAVATLTELLPSRAWLVGIPLAFAVFAWGCEISRRVWPSINDSLMRAFGPVAHAHERHRVNSSTWFVTALVILGAAFPRYAAAVGVVVLGFADPAAALVGRRFGRTKLYAGRSLQGTLAFVAVAFVAAMGLLALRHPASVGRWALVALAAAVVGALTELFTERLDDNFTIPLAAASAAALVGYAVGMH